MNEEKISSDQVPEKFAEWLLAMGCPPEKVPSVDKIAEMCRGQYYMVWRSLMEHVEPKQATKEKRLQVFRDDIDMCQKNNVFLKHKTSVVVPEELSLWKQQTDLKRKVADAENRMIQARQTLNQLMDKISSKLSHRNLARTRLQDAARRAWLLRQAADQLRAKRDNLLETRAIAHDLCLLQETADVESKLEQCLAACARASRRPAPAHSAGTLPPNNSELETEEQVVSLVQCGAAALCARLCAARAHLAPALTAAHAHAHAHRPTHHADGASPRCVLSRTAALHCALALDALKQRAHVTHTQKRLTDALNQLNNYLSGEECELLVLRCERGRAEVRVLALRSLLADVTSRGGSFAAAASASAPADRDTTLKQIATIDKTIESKRDELKRLITSLMITEKKIQNVRECLITVFNGFHGAGCQYDRFGGVVSLPAESISLLRQYYAAERAARRARLQLSMDLDASDHGPTTDTPVNSSPTFVDELKIYLKKFNLEKNRQLVLDSGEKLWVFQTLQWSARRVHERWQRDDVTSALACPAAGLARGLLAALRPGGQQGGTEKGGAQKKDLIDITTTREEEDRTTEKIKKRLNESLVGLQKSRKTLQRGRDQLRLWAGDHARDHLAATRTLDGKTYREYEACYLHSLNI